MERMGLKRTPSKLIVKGNLGWTRRKKSGYRDVVDIPIHCGSTMEHHYVDSKVEEDDGSGTDRTDCISFGSSVAKSTVDKSDNISHRTAKDAPGWIRDVGNDPYVRTREASLTQCHSSNTSQTQTSVASTTESCPCSDDEPCRTVIPRLVPADFNDGDILISTSVLPRRNQTQQSMAEILSPTLTNVENDEIELQSKGSSSSSSSSNSSTSLPPPGFVLPRKEIRDAILYHEELGKALSLLALDPDMKCIGNNGGSKHSVASTDSTALSTFNTSYSSNRGCRVGALHLRPTSPTQRNANVEFDDRMEQVSSMETASSRSELGCGSNQRTLLEQHLSFLESHTMQQVIPSPQKDGRRGHSIDFVPKYNSTIQSEPFDDFFFPGTDDLQSFPASATSCDVSRCISSSPNTPTLNPLRNDNMSQQLWFGQTRNERNDDIRLIKEEIALVMSEYNDKTLSDISVTVDTQLEKHLTKLKSDASELSERLDNVTRVWIPTDHCQGNKENHTSNLNKTPRTPRSENFVEERGLLHELQKAFSSMETRIVNTIASEMKANVMQQRQTIEEMVEEKISAAIAGSNLKIISDVQQIIQQEIGQSSMMTLGDKASPPTSSLRIDSLRKHHSRGPQSTMLDSVDSADIRTRSSAPDNSWIQSTSDPSSSANTDDPTQKSLEDSFSDTMKAIDEFVADCDEIASDFDRIALRMEGNDVDHDLDCDTDKFEVLIGTANGFVMF